MRRDARRDAKREPGAPEASAEPGAEASAAGSPGEAAAAGEAAVRRFRPPSRRAFVAMLGAAAAGVVLRDRISGRPVLRNPATGKPIWIGHV